MLALEDGGFSQLIHHISPRERRIFFKWAVDRVCVFTCTHSAYRHYEHGRGGSIENVAKHPYHSLQNYKLPKHKVQQKHQYVKTTRNYHSSLLGDRAVHLSLLNYLVSGWH